jgi:hypothetical protein
MGGDMSYLTDETRERHVLVVWIKWQNGTDRHIDPSTHGHNDRNIREILISFVTGGISFCS